MDSAKLASALVGLQAGHVLSDVWPGVLDVGVRVVEIGDGRRGTVTRCDSIRRAVLGGARSDSLELMVAWDDSMITPVTFGTALDLGHWTGRAHVARAAAAGVREFCERCVSAGEMCFRCRTGGEMDRLPWILPRAPLWHLLPSTESSIGSAPSAEAAVVLLGAHVARVLAGAEGISSILTEWVQWSSYRWVRHRCRQVNNRQVILGIEYGNLGRWCAFVARGETLMQRGEELTDALAMARADEVALDACLALVDSAAPGGVRVKWPEASRV